MGTQMSQLIFEWVLISNSLVQNLLFESCTGIFLIQKLFTAVVWNACLFNVYCIFFSKLSILHFYISKDLTNIKIF